MRIISGKYKGRVIATIKTSDYRPSTMKFREGLFSILSSGKFVESRPVENARVLDLFAGTGALSFEALSRGAKGATLVDINKQHLESALNFAEMLGEKDNIRIIAGDAANLPVARSNYNLVFMDPPYNKNYVIKSLSSLVAGKWLAENAIIVIETGKGEELKLPGSFELLCEKNYGKNKLLILKYE